MDQRVLVAERQGVLVAMAVAAVGRAVPVRCSPRLPQSAAWCAGRALAGDLGIWLLDVAPSAPGNDPDYALLAPGEPPVWGLRVDRMHGLALIERSAATPAGGLPGWPATWPANWVQSCVLADGRQAGLLAVPLISQALAAESGAVGS